VRVLFVIAPSPVLGSGKAPPELEQAGKAKAGPAALDGGIITG